MSGTIGITELQKARIYELETRKKDSDAGVKGVKPLTANMEKELSELLTKREKPELPQGAKTFIKEWVKSKRFNRKKEFKALVIDKGLAVEQAGIELIARVYGFDDLVKNDEFLQNEWCQGFPDLMHTKVRDVKSSWDLFTFPMFEDSLPDTDYWWQLQGYMWLSGIEEAALDYVLIDTPDPLVALDLKKLFYQSGGKPEDWNPDTHAALLPNYKFDDIPEKLRVKTFEFKYDPTVPQQIIQRVTMAREYIKTLLPEEFLQPAA